LRAISNLLPIAKLGVSDLSFLMNIGIIGFGYTGQQHARAIAEIEGVTLKAIADSESTKRSLAPVPSFADYRTLLDDDSIEAISICLPHHLHEEAASAAMLAGKHVLVEKPLAISVSAGERLCELAKAASRVLMVEMTHRFLPPLQEARRLIATGGIGEIMAVDEVLIEGVGLFGSLPAWMLTRDSAGGGVGLTSGIHLLDHISWITRQRLALSTACFGYTQELGDIEDTASFDLKMENGAPVHILLCWRKQDAGLDGHLIIVGSQGSLKVWPWEGITLESETKGIKQSFFQPGSGVAERALIGMKGAIQEFVDAIRQKRLPDPPADESLKSQAIVEQAYQQFSR
jgi:phthalate 4,5-cis-dihydrodiol dehydrogenase